MKRLIRILLVAAVVLLTYMCVQSILQGMASESDKQEAPTNSLENGNYTP